MTANLAAGIPQGPTAGRLLLRKQLAICTLLILCRQSPQHQLFVVRAGCVKSLVTLADAGERCRRVAISLMDVLSQVRAQTDLAAANRNDARCWSDGRCFSGRPGCEYPLEGCSPPHLRVTSPPAPTGYGGITAESIDSGGNSTFAVPSQGL